LSVNPDVTIFPPTDWLLDVKLYFIGDTVLEFLFEIVCYGIGKVIIPIVTLDRARSQGESEIVSFPWHGIARGSDGRFVLFPGLTGFCGIVVLVSLLFALVVAF
jgi:hypothetical protein